MREAEKAAVVRAGAGAERAAGEESHRAPAGVVRARAEVEKVGVAWEKVVEVKEGAVKAGVEEVTAEEVTAAAKVVVGMAAEDMVVVKVGEVMALAVMAGAMAAAKAEEKAVAAMAAEVPAVGLVAVVMA